jgi:hypothetical protein
MNTTKITAAHTCVFSADRVDRGTADCLNCPSLRSGQFRGQKGLGPLEKPREMPHYMFSPRKKNNIPDFQNQQCINSSFSSFKSLEVLCRDIQFVQVQHRAVAMDIYVNKKGPSFSNFRLSNHESC